MAGNEDYAENENTVRKSSRPAAWPNEGQALRHWGQPLPRTRNENTVRKISCPGLDRTDTRSRGGAELFQDQRRARRKINADVLDEFIALEVVEDRILLVFGNPALTAERP